MSQVRILVLALVAFLLMAGLQFETQALTQNVSGQGLASIPIITSVTPLTTNTSARITIKGSGFGASPQTTHLIDGSVDTNASTTSPSLAIWDGCFHSPCTGPLRWSAGHCCEWGLNMIGVYLSSWNDTAIVLNGFGKALGPNSSTPFIITAGDPITISIWGPNNAGEGVFQTYIRGSGTSVSTTVSMSGGAAGADQSSTTGIKVNITGSTAPNGTNVVIESAKLNGQGPGTGPALTPAPDFFDVMISGITDGSSRICITDSKINSTAYNISYWNGTAWIRATSISINGNTACGNIPVSALIGTELIAPWPPITPQELPAGLTLLIGVLASLLLYETRRASRRRQSVLL